MRLHGRGTVVLPGDPGFADLLSQFPKHVGIRSVIAIDVERVSDSCGYGVPTYEFVGERNALVEWANRKPGDQLAEYRAENNAKSIDGLKGLG